MNTLSPQLQNDLHQILNRIEVVQYIVDTCSDFTFQCITVRINHSGCIYYPFYSPSNLQRSTVVGPCGSKKSCRDFPSFLAITLRSVYPSSFDKPEFNLPPLATWLASAISNNINNNNCARYWANTLFLTGLTASMAVITFFTWLGHRTDHNFGAGSNEVVFR